MNSAAAANKIAYIQNVSWLMFSFYSDFRFAVCDIGKHCCYGLLLLLFLLLNGCHFFDLSVIRIFVSAITRHKLYFHCVHRNLFLLNVNASVGYSFIQRWFKRKIKCQNMSTMRIKQIKQQSKQSVWRPKSRSLNDAWCPDTENRYKHTSGNIRLKSNCSWQFQKLLQQ